MSTFYDRAKTMHDRGHDVRAAITLAEGLKRAPEHQEALDWLLRLYVNGLSRPGIEEDILHVLAKQSNGPELLEYVVEQLGQLGHHQKIRALETTLERGGFELRRSDPEEIAEIQPSGSYDVGIREERGTVGASSDALEVGPIDGSETEAAPGWSPLPDAATSGWDTDSGDEDWSEFRSPLRESSASSSRAVSDGSGRARTRERSDSAQSRDNAMDGRAHAAQREDSAIQRAPERPTDAASALGEGTPTDPARASARRTLVIGAVIGAILLAGIVAFLLLVSAEPNSTGGSSEPASSSAGENR